MSGADLRAARQRLGVDHRHIAEVTGLPASEVESWELFGEVPRRHRFAIDLALWQLECEKALESSDLPECERVRDLFEGSLQADEDVVARHAAECAVCMARGAYVDEHVRPMPIGGSPVMRVYGLIGRLNGWKRSAIAGAAILLMMGGAGVLVMLFNAIVRQDVTYVWRACGLFALLALSGAIGGIVHHLTEPLRKLGIFGYYSSHALTVLAYLLTVFGTLTVVARINDGAIEELSGLPDLTEPGFWIILLVVSIVFGIGLGRAFSDRQRDPEKAHPQRKAFSGRNLAFVLAGAGVILVAGSLLMSVANSVGLPYGEPEPNSPEEWEALLPELRAAAQEDPEDPMALGDLAWALVNLEYWDESGPVLREAVRLNPDAANLINALGWVELREGDRAGAIARFQNALTIDPEHHGARQNLGWAYYRMGRLEEAEVAYREVLRATPENAVAHGVLGRILMETGRLPLAEAAFREAIRLDPSDLEYHRGLMQALLQSGQIEPALESLYAASQVAPDDTGIWYQIARIAHISGKYEESLLAFERVHQLDPSVFDNIQEASDMREASRRGQPYDTPAP